MHCHGVMNFPQERERLDSFGISSFELAPGCTTGTAITLSSTPHPVDADLKLLFSYQLECH